MAATSTSSSKARQWQQVSDDDEEVGGSSSGSDSGDSSGSGSQEERTQLACQGESDLEDEVGSSDSDLDDDDDDDVSSATDDDGGSDDVEQREAQLRQQLSSVPFGALLKARKKLTAAEADEDELSEEDEWAEERAAAAKRSRARPKGNGSEADKREHVKQQLAALRDGKGASEAEAGPSRPRRDPYTITSRSNKHAPQEVSSRRPVSRKRNVVETSGGSSSSALRDPRFSNLSGPSVNAGMFAKSYDFLNEARSTELSTLRATLKKLNKLEANHAGPKASSESALKIREERAQVEQALKRQEAKEAERTKRAREAEVMRNFKRENDERVKQGGKRFFLKDSARREMMLQDKFSRLAGGNKRGRDGDGESSEAPPPASSSSSKALRKALDKRRKKNAAKERRELPFLDAGRRGAAGGTSSSRTRDGPPAKRKRGARGAGSKS